MCEGPRGRSAHTSARRARTAPVSARASSSFCLSNVADGEAGRGAAQALRGAPRIGLLAQRASGARSDHEGHARPALVALHRRNEEQLDLRGVRDVGAAARRDVEAVDVDHPNPIRLGRRLAQAEALSSASVGKNCRDRAILVDEPVDAVLRAADVVERETGAVDVDRASARAEAARDGRGLEQLEKSMAQGVLSRVEGHVLASPRLVHAERDGRAERREQPRDVVMDAPLGVELHDAPLGVELHVGHRQTAERAVIGHLAAGLRIEHGAIEDDGGLAPGLGVRDHGRVEGQAQRIVVVEALRLHARSLPRRRSRARADRGAVDRWTSRRDLQVAHGHVAAGSPPSACDLRPPRLRGLRDSNARRAEKHRRRLLLPGRDGLRDGARPFDECHAPGPIGVASVTTTRIHFTTVSPCFVATAAYGSPLEPRVGALRRLRNRHLHNHAVGRVLVRAYEAVGPFVADAIRDDDTSRAIARSRSARW